MWNARREGARSALLLLLLLAGVSESRRRWTGWDDAPGIQRLRSDLFMRLMALY